MLTVERIIEEVRRLAALHPDAVYEKEHVCSYTTGKAADGVGCLVGQAILSIDPNLRDTLASHNSETINGLLPVLGLERSNWLTDVQRAQDRRKPWKDAVALADKGAIYE